jgi:hypothetical protein
MGAGGGPLGRASTASALHGRIMAVRLAGVPWADGRMGEFGHLSSDWGGEGAVIGGSLHRVIRGSQPDGLPKLRCVGRRRDEVCGLIDGLAP